MPFYKKDGDSLLDAPNSVVGPGFELLAENKDTYSYPVAGWYWFDTLELAMGFFSTSSDSVPMLNAQLALDDAGLIDQVDATIVALGKRAQLVWRSANSVKKTDPLFDAVAGQLYHPDTPAVKGLSPAQIDALFEKARSYG